MLTLNAIVAPAQWLIKVMGDMAVELFVVIVANFASGTSPQRFGIVDGFPLEDDFRRFFFLLFIAWHCRWFLLKHFHRNSDMI